jgi:hypothetical protein
MNHPNHPTEAQLRQALRGLASEIAAANPAPPAAAIYLRAQLLDRYRVRRLAIARATLPLRIMQALGLLFAILTAAWALHQSLTNQDHTAIPLLKWSALALLLVLAGCWTLLQASRTPTTN